MNLKSYLFSTTCFAAVLFAAGSAIANPAGGVVSAGNASINQSGNRVDVVQTTDKAVIDWRSFDIDHNEVTEFFQPGSSSIALNRINDSKASVINGILKANGNLILLNQNGIMFGNGAVVDVNSLIATTADIDDQNFMAGNLKFDKAGNPDASIINKGTITAKEAGLVGFVAPNVINDGVISANLGRVHLASGDTATVDLYGDKLIEVAVSDKVKSQLVSNTGAIEAKGGKIALTAAAGKEIVNSIIDVKGELKAPAIAQKNGEIIIYAEGSNAVKGNISADKGKKQGSSKVEVAAKIDVSGKGQNEKGGKVTILGDNVAIRNGAEIDASGSTGGGDIKIGGDYQGKGETATALNLDYDAGAKIDNDAIDSGDGGRTILWADDSTVFKGDITGRGGANSGDGGFVEVSGKKYLTIGGKVDLTAGFGDTGTWLLDPTGITIVNRNASGGANIYKTSDLEATSVSANVILSTSDDIVLDLSDDTLNLTSGRSLSLTSGNDIIGTSGGSVNITGAGGIILDADHDINLFGHVINFNGGSAGITFTAGRDIVQYQGNISTSGGDIILNSNNTGVGVGAIYAGGSYYSNGGDIVFGGGLDPRTGFAQGHSIRGRGVETGGNNFYSGSADIIINGRGWDNPSCGSSNCNGVYMNGGTHNVQWGNLYITGYSYKDSGINIHGATLLTNNGEIEILGTSEKGTGVVIGNGSQITSAGTGTTGHISIEGHGSGSNTIGIEMVNGSKIEVVDAAVDIDGRSDGALTGDNRNGFTMNDHAVIKSTGTSASNTGNINIYGQAGDDAGVYGRGVQISNTSSIESVAGDIIIDGVAGRDIDNQGGIGVHIFTSSSVTTSGVGNINITGTGSNANTNINHGFSLENSSKIETTNNGSITVTGIGGGGSNSTGVLVDASQIESNNSSLTVSGTIDTNTTGSARKGVLIKGTDGDIFSLGGVLTVIGTSANGGNSSGNNGVELDNTSGAGMGTYFNNTNITATAGASTGNNNFGLFVTNAASIYSSGGIAINAYGGGSGGSDYNHGVYLNRSSVISTYQSASIDITATAGAGSNASDIRTFEFSNGIYAQNANITLNANTLDIDSANIQSNNDVIIKPRTAGTSIGLAGGNGTLNLTVDELNRFNSQNIIIGTSTSGIVNINAWDISAKNYDVEVYGSEINLNGALSLDGSNDLLFSAVGDVNIGSSNITKVEGGHSDVDIRAGQNINIGNTIGFSGANTEEFNIFLSADRTANLGNYKINNTASTFITNGGTFSASGIFGVNGGGAGNTTTVDTDGGAVTFGTITNYNGTGAGKTVSIDASDGGNITFNGNVNGAFDFSAKGEAITFGGGSTNWGGTTALGKLTIEADSNNITLPGSITTTDDVLINANYANIYAGSINTGAGDLKFTSNDIEYTGNLTGTGTLTFEPKGDIHVRVSFYDNDYNLSTAEINRITNGWGEIVIGRDGLSNSIVVGTSTWNDNVRFLQSWGTDIQGDITVNGTNNFHITSGGSVISSNIALNGGNFTVDGNFSVRNQNHVNTISTGNGNITFGGTLYADDSAGSTLTLAAGTGTVSFGNTVNGNYGLSASGNSITFNGAWGGSTPLAAVTLSSVNNIVLPAITANTLEVNSTATVTQNGALNLTNLLLKGTGGVYNLTNTSNAITTLAASTGTVNFVENSGYNIGSISSTNGITATNLYLSSTGTVTQSTRLNATNVSLAGTGGTYTLTDTDNVIDKVAANTGSIDIYSSTDVTIDTITNGSESATGVTTTAKTKIATDDSITMEQSITAGGSGTTLELLHQDGLIINTGNLNPGSGRYLVWGVNPVDDDLGSLAFDFIHYNATYGLTTPGQADNGLMYTYAPEFTAGLTGSVQKIYDNTDVATLAAGNYNITSSPSGYASGAIDHGNGRVDNITISGTGVYGNKNVGNSINVSTNDITITAEDNTTGATIYGYRVNSSANANIGQITPKDITVTAVDAGKNAGDVDPAFTYNYTGLASGDLSANFTGSLSRAAGETANTYAINIGSLAATGNYSIGTYNPAVFTITAVTPPPVVNPPAGGNEPPKAENLPGQVLQVSQKATVTSETKSASGFGTAAVYYNNESFMQTGMLEVESALLNELGANDESEIF